MKQNNPTHKYNKARLLSHIEWLRGDHEFCNPFLADDIESIINERNKLLNQKDNLIDIIGVMETEVLLK